MIAMSKGEGITELEKAVLATILSESNSHRPSAITRILRKQQIECDQNMVVQALNSLEKRDLVERDASKTWVAKGKAADYLD